MFTYTLATDPDPCPHERGNCAATYTMLNPWTVHRGACCTAHAAFVWPDQCPACVKMESWRRALMSDSERKRNKASRQSVSDAVLRERAAKRRAKVQAALSKPLPKRIPQTNPFPGAEPIENAVWRYLLAVGETVSSIAAPSRQSSDARDQNENTTWSCGCVTWDTDESIQLSPPVIGLVQCEPCPRHVWAIHGRPEQALPIASCLISGMNPVDAWR